MIIFREIHGTSSSLGGSNHCTQILVVSRAPSPNFSPVTGVLRFATWFFPLPRLVGSSRGRLVAMFWAKARVIRNNSEGIAWNSNGCYIKITGWLITCLQIGIVWDAETFRELLCWQKVKEPLSLKTSDVLVARWPASWDRFRTLRYVG